MKGTVETRASGRCEVVVYAAHEAFLRDLGRLTAVVGEVAALREGAYGDVVWVGWRRFALFLRVHHAAGAAGLWPGLRATRPDLAAWLERMEYERIGLVGLFDGLEASLLAADPGWAVTQTQRFALALAAYFREEESVLRQAGDLLDARVWAEFAYERWSRLGLRGVTTFFPWLADGAPAELRRTVLAELPPPFRVLYRAVWLPRYLRGPGWQATASSGSAPRPSRSAR